MHAKHDSATPSASSSRSGVYRDLIHHSTAPYSDAQTIVRASILSWHPDQHVTAVDSYECDLLSFAANGGAQAIRDPSSNITWRTFLPPVKRSDPGPGVFKDAIDFARYLYHWKDKCFTMYVFRDMLFQLAFYIVSGRGKELIAEVDALIAAATKYHAELHGEIWVYDEYWAKDRTLYKNVQKGSWEDVILDPEMRDSLIADVEGFFKNKDVYHEYGVPWKRGLIFYGPPGNGKTVSLMASMHSLSPTIPCLYVKSMSDEYNVRDVFLKARAEAPCLLVMEDLDSIVTPDNKSYFFNELDGLESNDGILTIGTTNYLDRLDPGLAKRPSRFDRKYDFPLPIKRERVEYCLYWRRKIRRTSKLEFPEKLCDAIAGITDGFSFAYLKEAFVASLLEIARRGGEDLTSMYGGDDSDLDKILLWRVIKKQIEILRDQIGQEENEG